MVEHDGHIGQLLKKLDDLGVADNTIVIWTTDNGAEVMSWPDGGTTPFRGEKNTNWEGGYRVPLVVRWPGVIKPGTEINEIISHEDWLPTLLAAAGQPNVKESALTGLKAGDATYKVHLDGYNLMPVLQGRDEGVAAQGVRLLDRRRRPRRLCASSSGRWSSSSSARGSRCLAGSAGRAALPQAVQPPGRSVRARGQEGMTTGTGGSSTRSCWARPQGTSPSGSRASRTSRRARSPAPSTSAT